MKAFNIIFCIVVMLSEAGMCGQSDGYTSHLQTRQGSYDWNIRADQLLSTPEWSSQAQPIPLPLDKACKLGQDWLARHRFQKFDLDEARLVSYPAVWIAAVSQGKIQRRFYYWLVYRSEDSGSEFMYVYVLLDGTVVEPKFTATPEKKP